MSAAGAIAAVLERLPAAEAHVIEAHLQPAVQRALTLARRDAAIRRAAAFWQDQPPTRQAIEIAAALRRYHAGAWQRDGVLGKRPEQPIAAALHAVLDNNGGQLLDWRQIARVLNGERKR